MALVNTSWGGQITERTMGDLILRESTEYSVVCTHELEHGDH